MLLVDYSNFHKSDGPEYLSQGQKVFYFVNAYSIATVPSGLGAWSCGIGHKDGWLQLEWDQDLETDTMLMKWSFKVYELESSIHRVWGYILLLCWNQATSVCSNGFGMKHETGGSQLTFTWIEIGRNVCTTPWGGKYSSLLFCSPLEASEGNWLACVLCPDSLVWGTLSFLTQILWYLWVVNPLVMQHKV